MSSSSSFLNDAHFAQLKAAQQAIQRAKVELDLAERAGIDVSAQRAQIQASEDQNRKLMNTYFPNQT